MGMHNQRKASAAQRESLPSRSEYRRIKKKKRGSRNRRFNISVPLALLLLLLLLPVAILSIIYVGDRPNAGKAVTSSGEEVLFETDEPDAAQKTASIVTEDEPRQEAKKDERIPAKKQADQKEEKEPKGAANKDGQQKDASPEHNDGAPAEEQGGFLYHQVQPGETLFRIAMNYYKSQDGIEKIRQANGLSGNEISVGQTLKIPKQ